MSDFDQTNSDEFKHWFGDSKVVGPDGNPLVLYHATVAEFDAFKTRPGDIGIHFGTKGQAEDRFRLKIESDPCGPSLRGVAHATIPVFLSLNNPLRIRDVGVWTAENVIRELPAELAVDLSGIRNVSQLRAALKRNGYDGIVYRNTGEADGAWELRASKESAWHEVCSAFSNKRSFASFSVDEQKHPAYLAYQSAKEAYKNFRERNAEDSYIAFSPTRIKSAIGNSGRFDPESASLTDQDDAGWTVVDRIRMTG